MIDARQSYLQDVVVAGLRALGYRTAGRAVHPLQLRDGRALAALLRRPRHRALRRGSQARRYVEVSGRKGLGVKADDLMDNLIAKALEEVASRHPDDTADEQPHGRHPDRHRRAAVFPAEVHPQHRDRVRLAGSAELRRRDRALRAIRRRARRRTSCANWRSAAKQIPDFAAELLDAACHGPPTCR